MNVLTESYDFVKYYKWELFYKMRFKKAEDYESIYEFNLKIFTKLTKSIPSRRIKS